MEAEKSRLELFKEFVELDPSDTFSRYALGMEYMGVSEYENAIGQFDSVIGLSPNEPPAYFQAGLACISMDQKPRAKEYLVRGIEVAERIKDRHARDEMQAALDQLDVS